MGHFSDERLMQLADIFVNKLMAQEEDFRDMEHLRSCDDCFRQYCHYISILDTTGDVGMSIVPEIVRVEASNRAHIGEMSSRAVAKFNIMMKTVKECVTGVIEQIDIKTASMCFETPLAYATRGGHNDENRISRLEDIKNDNNFIYYDSDKKKLMIQLETENLYHVVVDNQTYEMKRAGSKLIAVIELDGDNHEVQIIRG